MSKKRNRKARLGKVLPSATANEPRMFHAKADSKCLHFQRLWARKEDGIAVPLSDILDFGLNRNLVVGERVFQIGFNESGIFLREHGSGFDRVISYRDLLALVHGQTLIPTMQ